MKRLMMLWLLVLSGCYQSASPRTTDIPIAPERFYAPDFTLTGLEGDSYTLSDQRGRWIILNFWQTTCIPCVEEMPALQQIADDYADRLAVWGVNIREGGEVIAPFLAEHGIRFPILYSSDAVMLDYQVIGMPQTVIIAPDGDIAYRQFGPIELAAFRDLFASLAADD